MDMTEKRIYYSRDCFGKFGWFGRFREKVNFSLLFSFPFPLLFLSISLSLSLFFLLSHTLFSCSKEREKIEKGEYDRTLRVDLETHAFPDGETFVFSADFISGLQPERTLRVFAVGHRIDLKKDFENEETYFLSYKKFMDFLKPYFSRTYKNLVVFEEHAGLPLLFAGERGKEARNQSSSTSASLYLFISWREAIEYYGQKFPSIATMQARLIFVSLTDTLWRFFFNTFSRLAKEYSVWIVSCQNTPYPEIKKRSWNEDPELAQKLVDESVSDKTYFYEAESPEIWNTCFVFSPEGDIVHKTRKVNLVPTEKNDLQFSSGRYEELEVFRIPGTEVDICIGISLDAFVPEYIKILDEKGCDIFLQPDANAGAWASVGGLGRWQPDEWTSSTIGSIQTNYFWGCMNPHEKLFEIAQEGGECEFMRIDITWRKSIVYNVNPMMTGNLFEVSFDGQSAITGRDKRARRDINYVGLPPLDEMKEGGEKRFPEGGFILLGPWRFDVPKNLPLEEQREKLMELQKTLFQGGENENKYLSTVLGADLYVP